MATICKKVCDRCGKQIHYIGWTSKLKKIGILSILNGNPSGYDYSLCRECTKELNDFLRKR